MNQLLVVVFVHILTVLGNCNLNTVFLGAGPNEKDILSFQFSPDDTDTILISTRDTIWAAHPTDITELQMQTLPSHSQSGGGIFTEDGKIWTVSEPNLAYMYDPISGVTTDFEFDVPYNHSLVRMTSLTASASNTYAFLIIRLVVDSVADPTWIFGILQIGESNLTALSWTQMGEYPGVVLPTVASVYDESRQMLYIAGGITGIKCYDVSDMSSPSYVRTVGSTVASIQGVYLEGDGVISGWSPLYEIYYYDADTGDQIMSIEDAAAHFRYDEHDYIAMRPGTDFLLNIYSVDSHRDPIYSMILPKNISGCTSIVASPTHPNLLYLIGIDNWQTGFIYSLHCNLTAVASTSSDPSSMSTSDAETHPIASSSPKNTSAIVGGVIGGILGLLVLAAVVVIPILVVQKKRRHVTGLPELELPPVIHVEISAEWKINFQDLVMVEEIGQGAHGTVHKVTWRGAVCAAKMISGSGYESFQREVTCVRSLRPHVNLLKMLGVCVNPYVLVMEYLPDGNIRNFMEKEDIKLDRALFFKIAMDVANGMSHLHRENFVHCDLAARNLLASIQGSEFQVKIADFGMTRAIDGVQEVEDWKNFPIRWTAPEVLVLKKLCKASDVWSFGISMWEIVEHKLPYHTLENKDVVQRICRDGERLAKPTTILNEDDWNMISRCWDSDPEKRPSGEELSLFFAKPDDETDDHLIEVMAEGHEVSVSIDTSFPDDTPPSVPIFL